jgi:signal transduction histidine kinase
MMSRFAPPLNLRLAALLALGVCGSVAVLGLSAYRAVREWERTAILLAERHAQEGADMLALALTRDMRGAQESVLSSEDWLDSSPFGPGDVRNLVSSTFARFPYPELFFKWRGQDGKQSVQFFARADRVPPWLTDLSTEEAVAVVVGRAPGAAHQILERVNVDITQHRVFSIFDIRIDGTDYQAVVHLQYLDLFREELRQAFGFIVDLNWVRQNYFPEVARQVARIVSADSSLVFSMYPERDNAARNASRIAGIPIGRRVVPMTFFDPFLIAVEPPPDLNVENWTLETVATDDATVRLARTGARRTAIVIALGGTVFAVGLALTLYSTYSQAKQAQLRADFVSIATHELKTPIATIRAAGDTLVSRRLANDQDASHRYAQLMVHESKHLTRLLDNLLAYSRITDTTDAYLFGPIAVRAILEQALRTAKSRLDTGGFEVHVDIADDLPNVRADWTALCLALDNLVDNAIRYSKDNCYLRLGATRNGNRVTLEVTDHGIGIPAGEVPQVTRKFFRGRGTVSGGSGLGLAMVERIVTDHSGTLSITSTVGVGTTVALSLPVST